MGTGNVFDDYNSEPLLNHLVDRQEYFAKQAMAMEEMQQGHIENIYDTHEAIEDLLTSMNGLNFKGSTAPALKRGIGQLRSNSKEANKSTTGLVKPENIHKNFADATQFNAEIAKYYPAEARRIEELKRELKLHHFDLANLIKDVNVHASGTHDNLDRVKRKLFLR